MSERAQKFIDGWVLENIQVETYLNEDGDDRPKAYAKQCIAAAEAKGISKKELEETVGGDLVSYMAGEMTAATDAEVKRLAEKDD